MENKKDEEMPDDVTDSFPYGKGTPVETSSETVPAEVRASQIVLNPFISIIPRKP
jgi:hypothetical protein